MAYMQAHASLVECHCICILKKLSNMKRKRKENGKAKKVWIFKWLLKKNGCCGVHLVEDFSRKNGKKTTFFKVILSTDDSKSLVLTVDILPDPSFLRRHSFLRSTVFAPVEVPCKYNVSYADVLDSVLKAMKKNDSDCWLSDSWSNRHVSLFLKRGTSLEELKIGFDLSSRDVFGQHLRKSEK